jgi:nitrile hydratase
MNGVHDMGGMQNMGPIEYEKDEPVFHHDWEARSYALTRAMGAWGKWNIDASRYERELLPPADYLRMSYYESWIVRLEQLLIKSGLVTKEEIETARPASGSVKATPPLQADRVAMSIRKGTPFNRDTPVVARFNVNQKVRARNLNPVGHTRLPRYVRGKSGTVVRDHGVFVFPDTNAHFLGEKPQHLYSVKFNSGELWGTEARPHDTVYLDLWEDYLEQP